MEDTSIEALYNNYLSQTFILFEMVKAIGKRPLSLKMKIDGIDKAIRYFPASNLDFLKKPIEKYNIKKIPRNFYIGCSTLSFIPLFTYDLHTRTKSPEYIKFNEDYEKYITGFDFFIDIDGKEDFKKALEEIKELQEAFDEMKLPFYIIPSSSKGFHLVIPEQYVPKLPIEELLTTIKIIQHNLIGTYDLKCIDKSVLMDIKQLRKVPYSPTLDGYVCLPLSPEQLIECEKSMDFLKIDNVMKNVRIKNRGLLIHNIELPEEELKQNVEKFFKLYKTLT